MKTIQCQLLALFLSEEAFHFSRQVVTSRIGLVVAEFFKEHIEAFPFGVG